MGHPTEFVRVEAPSSHAAATRRGWAASAETSTASAAPRAREGRRAKISRWSSSIGVTGLLSRLARPSALTVLTYHRIGDHLRTPFDAELFSATAGEFDQQVAYLRKHFRLLTLAEALDFIECPERHGGGVLMTFDDGYRDNYDVAFPILQRHGVPATFFLPTALVGSNAIPWWDHIAYCVRNTTERVLRLPSPWTVELHREALGVRRCVQALLRIYKSLASVDAALLLAAVEEAAGVRPDLRQRRFLDWSEAERMVKCGMDVGSHTHSHAILSRLAPDAQHHELVRSREILESRLGIPVQTLAYPVGAKDSFNDTTIAALEAAGYRAAFSYSKDGINFPNRLRRFDLLRLSVDRDVTLPQFSLRVAAAALSGKVFV